MKERVFTFGSGEILMGVLTEPAPEVERRGAPVLVVTNVGLNPRVGPQRMWVELARGLAKLGFATFRFDLNGLGDSLARRDASDDITRATTDLTEALDFLQKKRGFTRFVIIGMCSGVDSAHRVATADARVVGAAFLEGYAWPTPRSQWTRHVGRHFSVQGLKRAIGRRLPRQGGSEVGEADEIYVRDYPTVTQMAADLERMLARDAKLLFIYSGGVWLTFNYREQFFEMLRPARFEGRIEVELHTQADHTWMIPSRRAYLLDRLSAWVVQRFGG